MVGNFSMGPKKKKKRLRGAVPGTSQFANISARAAAGKRKPAPAIGLPKSDEQSSGSLATGSIGSLPLPEVSGSDLDLVAASGSVPVLDLNSTQENSPLATVVGSTSGDAVQGESSVGFGSLSAVADPITAPAGSIPTIVEGSTSDVVNVSSPITVAGPSSGDISPESSSPDKVVSPGSRKYAEVARDPSCLEEIGTPTQHITGVPFVFIPDENIQAAKVEFKDFIFAQFHGPPPAMGRVIGVVNAIWARSGPRIFVHRIGEGTFLLKVTNSRAREMILSRNMWSIVGHPMFVAPWSPDFNPDTPPISSAIVTVEFRGIPYLLFNNESLGRIATAVGKPVALAPETARKENFEVAKILVRVNLLKELPTRVVSGFSDGREIDIDVSYPWLPPRCTVCDQFGHETSACRRNAPSASGRKVARRSTSRRGRPSRRERLSRKSREGRSRTVASSRFITSSVSVKEGTSDDSKTVRSSEVSASAKEGISTDQQSASVAVASVVSSCKSESVEAELPFILVPRKRSGRKAASLH